MIEKENEKYTPLVQEVKRVIGTSGNFLGYDLCKINFGYVGGDPSFHGEEGEFIDRKVKLINDKLKDFNEETIHVFGFSPKAESFDSVMGSTTSLSKKIRKSFVLRGLLEEKYLGDWVIKNTYAGLNNHYKGDSYTVFHFIPYLNLEKKKFDSLGREVDFLNFGFLYNSFEIGKLVRNTQTFIRRKEELKTKYSGNLLKDFGELTEKNIVLDPKGKNFRDVYNYSLKGSVLILPFFNEKHFKASWKKDLGRVSSKGFGIDSFQRTLESKDFIQNIILGKNKPSYENYFKRYSKFHEIVFPKEWNGYGFSGSISCSTLKKIRLRALKKEKEKKELEEKNARERQLFEIESLEKKLLEEKEKLEELK